MRLLIVEDEADLRGWIVELLRAEGWACDEAGTLADAERLSALHSYDLVVLDRQLPDGDGLTACRRWREEGSETAVILVTALADAADIVDGFEEGADDHLAKPFDAGVLVARVRALLRRRPTAPRPKVTVGALTVDRERRQVWLAGDLVPCTGKEFALLEFLALADHAVVERLTCSSSAGTTRTSGLQRRRRPRRRAAPQARRSVDRDGARRRLPPHDGTGMRPRLPLALLSGAILGVAIFVPTAGLDRSERQRAHDAQRATVSYAALDLVATARTVRGKLDISRFSSVAYRPGQPASLFIDAKGRYLDGDLPESEAFRQAALRRAESNDNSPVQIGDRVVVVEPIASAQDPTSVLAAAVSYVDGTLLRQEVASESRARWAIAIGGWALLTLLLTAGVLRLLSRPLRNAATERTFFADAAHELRTPWALVRAHAERAQRRLAGRGDLTDELTELAAITATSTTAARTVDDMLMLARLDRGVVGEPVRLRLDALVDTCVSELRERHGDDLDVTFHSTPQQITVVGHEALLTHAVTNLLENAVRHGEPPISVVLTRPGSRARLSVIDSGPGIPPSQRTLAFERFHRASARGGGSGLGLSIARAAVEAHRGKLTYAERPDEHGAVFTIDLPAT